MKLSDKLKKQIKEQSTKSQEPYAGLMTDLRVKYKPYSNTGLKAMEMLYDIASGADADTLDGLKTRLVRLDQLREYLLKASLEPREQKKVFAAYTKVQSAVRGHKDQYNKKFADISKLLDGASSNIVNALDSALDEFPLFKAMLSTGTFAARKIKEQKQKRAQTLRSRNDVLRKDSEQMYARELEKENDVKPGKGKGGNKGGKNFFTRPTPKMSGAEYVHDNTAPAYTTQAAGAGMEYMQDMAQNIAAMKDVVTTELLNELRELNKYNSWQKTQAKDRKLDDLEATREASRNNPLKLTRDRSNRDVQGSPGESSNQSGGGIVDTALDMLGIGAAAKGAGKLAKGVFKGAGKAVGGIGSILKGGIAGKALGGVAKMGGKSLLKKIPLLGLGAGGIFAIQRALSGDFKGAGLELASGAASTLPGLGTAASVGIDATLAAKDAGVFDGPTGAGASGITPAPAGTLNAKASVMPLASLTKNMNIKDLLGADDKGLGLLFPLKALDAIAAIATGGTASTQGNTQTRSGIFQRDNTTTQKSVSLSNRMGRKASTATRNMMGKPATPAIPSGGTKSTEDMKNLALKELQAKGITDPTQQANILANLQAESGFKPQSENLNYSATTLMRLFGPGSGNTVRVRSLEEAQAIVDQGPEAVGNLIYGGRMGNAGDEGYKYRGRGLVQLTGKNNYTDMSEKLGVDLVSNPDLANDPAIAAKIQAQYYADRQSKFDYSNVNQVSKATGHAAGTQENIRRAGLAEQLKQDINSGKISPEGIIEPQNIAPNVPIMQAAVSVPQMTPNQQTVADGSKSTALAQAAPQTPAIMPVAGPGPTINMSSSSDGQPNTDTGTDSRRKSYVEAVNA